MIKFDDYREKYSHIRMERQGGILQITFHTEGAALKWSGPSHEQLGYAFADIARDQENRVVIMTGTGDAFCAEIDMSGIGRFTPEMWDHVYKDGKHLLMNLLDIEVPVIAAVNGPALIHAEVAVLSDIVIAAETLSFRTHPIFPTVWFRATESTLCGRSCWELIAAVIFC